MRLLLNFLVCVMACVPPAPLAAQGATSGITVRRLLPADPGYAAQLYGPTPDGRSVTQLMPATGDLGLRDLVTGQARPITRNPAPYSPGMAYQSRVSPDGRWVAYAWLGMTSDTSDVRMSPLGGAEIRVLYRGSRGDWAVPTDWSRDGGTVAIVAHHADGSSSILLAPAAGGEQRVLRRFDSRAPRTVQFSPDGRFVAYDRAIGNTTDRRIFVTEVSSGTERELLRTSTDDRVMGWTPDGRGLVMLRTGEGAPGAWLVPVADGRATGQPTLLRGDLWRATPVTSTHDGRFYFTVETGGRGVYVADIDPTTGDIRGTPTRFTRNGVGRDTRLDWSPDGRFIAHSVRHEDGSPMSMIVTSVESGQSREFTLPPDVTSPQDHRWFPDGSALLIRSMPKGSSGFLRMDAQTGRTETILIEPGIAAVSFDIFPDGRRIIYRQQSPRRDTTGNSHVVVRDLASGTERVLFSTSEPTTNRLRWSALSRDGGQYAFVRQGGTSESYELVVIPTSGGTPRVVARGDESSVFWSMAWAPDGRSIYVGRTNNRAPDADGVGSRTLWRIPVDGREPTQLTLDLPQATQPRFDPTGRRLAFGAGVGGLELWVLEGVPAGASRSGARR